MSANGSETSFKDYLRGLEPETHTFARSMLDRIKDQIVTKVRSGAKGEISASADFHALAREYPIIWKEEKVKNRRKLFQSYDTYTVYLELSLLPKIVEALPYLKQIAAEEGITVSDPYFILTDLSSGDKQLLKFWGSHVTYDYCGSPGLDGWEQKVWADAYLDYSISI